MNISDCCNAVVIVVGGTHRSATNYYVCSSCNKPCDAHNPEAMRQQRAMAFDKKFQESQTNGSMNEPGQDHRDGLD